MPKHEGVELLSSSRRQQAGALRAAKTLSAAGALGCAIAGATLVPGGDVYTRLAGWGWLSNAAIYAVALAVLVLRRRWSAGQAQAVSLLLIVTTLATQVYADWYRALSPARFAPSEAFKIVALCVATIVPFRPALAYALVWACAAIPLALYAVMPAEARAHLPVGQAWLVVIYPLIATGFLMFRVRALRTEREMIRARAQAEELERFAKVSLAYRDLANSPLQIIELLRAELHKLHPESKERLDRLQRSLARLRAMGEMLSHAEHKVVWTSKEEAFDAAQVIAEYQGVRVS